MSSGVTISKSIYGQHQGRDIHSFVLTNANGVEATVLTFGAILASLFTPSSQGKGEDIVLGYDTMEKWAENPPYFGATVGRHANRIAGGSFSLDGTTHTLACNNEPAGIPSHLHGGIQGFDKKIWSAETSQTSTSASVVLTYVSPAGEEGYPGTLTATITYTLNAQNQLIWDARATTDAPTVVNLVNHTYWNLSGDLTSHIGDHLLKVESSSYLQSTPGLIPTGKLAQIEFTPLDFTEPKLMGQDIDAPFQALTEAEGYDQAFVLENGGKLALAAAVHHPGSGRALEIYTDQPAVHFYTGNFIPDLPLGKYNQRYSRRCGFCLETENYPDAPNNPQAPSPVLRPGETYRHQMVCQFSW